MQMKLFPFGNAGVLQSVTVFVVLSAQLNIQNFK